MEPLELEQKPDKWAKCVLRASVFSLHWLKGWKSVVLHVNPLFCGSQRRDRLVHAYEFRQRAAAARPMSNSSALFRGLGELVYTGGLSMSMVKAHVYTHL